MKKRTTLLVALVLILALSLSTVSNATQIQPYVNEFIPLLVFEGTTANCYVKVYRPGSDISVTLTLRYGGTRCATWYGNGTDLVIVNQVKEVAAGNTYTLTATVTIDGVTLAPSSVSVPCG